MTAEECIAQLETELVEERAKNAMLQAELVAQRAETTSAQEENAQLCQQLEQIVTRLREVEKRLAKDSRIAQQSASTVSRRWWE